MGRRRNADVAKSGAEECENLHEMETQRIDLDLDLSDGATSGSPSSLIISSPALEAEGRRVTRRSLLEANTPKVSTRTTANSRKRALRTTRASKSTPSKDELIGTGKSKSRNQIEVEKPQKTPKANQPLKETEIQVEENSNSGEKVPLEDFMASLNASPTSASAKNIEISAELPERPAGRHEEPSSSGTVKNNETTGAMEESTGKLRSSVADSEGLVLARSYRKTLRETEEYALNYISQEFHHPVITCFRELTKGDISSIVGSSKLKKSCNSLEQSIVYLGLIDLLATVNNNPVYGESESSKLSKNVSNVVQKVLLEFKNIMGTWALSGNEKLSGRYSQIISYLRVLVPMFKKAGFDEGFSNILDCIEKEVSRHKQNQEKIKAMSNGPRGSENNVDKITTSTTDSHEADSRSALNEIVLNVDLNVKLDDSDDDEDVTVLKEDKLKIFGKPLKGSPQLSDSTRKKSKKPKPGLDPWSSECFKSPKTQPKQNNEKTPKSHVGTKEGTLPAPKTLAKVFQSSLPLSPKPTSVHGADNVNSKTPPIKRSANEDAVGLNEKAKKRKIEDGSTNTNKSEPKSSIKNFFQSTTSRTGPGVAVSPSSCNIEKPTVNAFALMMNRSREMAQKKKVDKLKPIPVPTLKVNAVKS